MTQSYRSLIAAPIPAEAIESAEHVPYPHSVVTQHLIDQAGEPTIAARDEILAFFRMRLAPVAGAACLPLILASLPETSGSGVRTCG